MMDDDDEGDSDMMMQRPNNNYISVVVEDATKRRLYEDTALYGDVVSTDCDDVGRWWERCRQQRWGEEMKKEANTYNSYHTRTVPGQSD